MPQVVSSSRKAVWAPNQLHSTRDHFEGKCIPLHCRSVIFFFHTWLRNCIVGSEASLWTTEETGWRTTARGLPLGSILCKCLIIIFHISFWDWYGNVFCISSGLLYWYSLFVKHRFLCNFSVPLVYKHLSNIHLICFLSPYRFLISLELAKLIVEDCLAIFPYFLKYGVSDNSCPSLLDQEHRMRLGQKAIFHIEGMFNLNVCSSQIDCYILWALSAEHGKFLYSLYSFCGLIGPDLLKAMGLHKVNINWDISRVYTIISFWQPLFRSFICSHWQHLWLNSWAFINPSSLQHSAEGQMMVCFPF